MMSSSGNQPSSSGNQPSSSSGGAGTGSSRLVSAQALFKLARTGGSRLNIKHKEHEVMYFLHTKDYDEDFGVHEKLRRPNKRDRISNQPSGSSSPSSGMGNGVGPSCKKNGDDEDNVDYNVARIKTASLTDEGPKFLVEWQHYPCEDTWESYENCGDCVAMDHFESWWPRIDEEEAKEVLIAFQLFVKRNLDPTRECDIAILLKLSETKLKDLKRGRIEFEEQKVALVKRIKSIYYPLIHYNDLGNAMKASTLVTLATKRLKVDRLDEIMDLKDKRVSALRKLSMMKNEMNETIETIEDGPPVEIENLVDDDVFKPFVYVKDYHTVDVVYDDQTCLTCNCDDRCVSSSCPCLNEHPRAYDQFKNLTLAPGNPIYECNPRCSCGITCKMRVISEGRKYKLCIFKTDDGRGWGLRTLERIPPRKFVLHYTGELLTVSKSEERESARQEYNRYLFALDYAPVVGIQGLEENVIDAKDYGNLSRFINHSVCISMRLG